MRQQLIHYVDLLFAGAPQAQDMKQEILQNTLDRYDDLVAQGKAPQAAYQLAIGGIGDINELLGNQQTIPSCPPTPPSNRFVTARRDNKLVVGIAVAMYILCPTPLFILGNVGDGSVGLCLMFLLIATATALLIIWGKPNQRMHFGNDNPSVNSQGESELKKSIRTLTGVLSWIAFLALSIFTGKWLVTWLVFPIFGAVNGLIYAIIDLTEANKHES